MLTSHRSPRIAHLASFAAALLVAMATAYISPTAAMAVAAAPVKTFEKDVDATLQFRVGFNPDNVLNCEAAAFAQWEDVPGTTSATVTVQTPWSPFSRTATPPFDDHYHFVGTFDVPGGSHWISIGQSWTAGGGAATCTDLDTKNQQNNLSVKARLTITAKRPTITLPRRTATLSDEQRAFLAHVKCPDGGDCRIEVKNVIGFTMNGRRYTAKVVGPRQVAGGKTVALEVFFPARTINALAGRDARLNVKVKATNSGVISTTRWSQPTIKMPKTADDVQETIDLPPLPFN